MANVSHLIEKHEEALAKAMQACETRELHAHWPELPSGKIYGETANDEGQAAFKARLNSAFVGLKQEGAQGSVGAESSPFGFDLGITYPSFSASTLVEQAQEASRTWRAFSVQERAAILLECLEQAAASFFEVAYATMHTTGQGFMMAFQASGPHAWDRALESVAMGLRQQSRLASDVTWKKRVGKEEWVTVEKSYHAVPKGVGLVIGCSTFPIWNSTSAMFANLITGNAAIAKPHPGAILPIAIFVAEMQKALHALGLNPHLVQLAPDTMENPISMDLIEHEGVHIVDYTGGPAFGNVVEEKARQLGKVVFTEKSGVNPVIIDSVENLDAVLQNLAFSSCLYSGQMCTAPQNIFISKDGVKEGDTVIPFAEVCERLVKAVDGLSGHPKIGPGTLGAIQNQGTADRIEAAQSGAEVLRKATSVAQPGFDNARSLSPAILKVTADDTNAYAKELFGPVLVVVESGDFDESLALVSGQIRQHGALSCLVYTTDAEKKAAAREEIVFNAGSPLGLNFTGMIWINQSTTFTDFHGTGANPAGNASFTDETFVAARYNVIGVREVVS